MFTNSTFLAVKMLVTNPHNMLLILITTMVLYLGGDIYLLSNSNITVGYLYSYIGTYQLSSFVTNKS
jgi:hypothetical protein